MTKIEMDLPKQKQVLKNLFLKPVANILNNLHNIERNFLCVGRSDHPGLNKKPRSCDFQGVRNVFVQES